MPAAAAHEVSFDVTAADAALIDKITARAVQIGRKHGQRVRALDTRMDITATHANGNPLRLADLLAADDFNLAHDVFGIARHLNRATGQLENHFSPRFSAPQAEPA
jgi:hypothetical protein